MKHHVNIEGLKLIKMREYSGMSRYYVAKNTNISKRILMYWEQDVRNPSDIESLNELANLYNCYIDDFVGNGSFAKYDDTYYSKWDNLNHLKRKEMIFKLNKLINNNALSKEETYYVRQYIKKMVLSL